jgi:hypothetical protein
MFKFNQLESVHIEISSRCQASCPMCPRNIHGGIDNPSLELNDWTYEDFVKIFNTELLLQIKRLTFCGSFGDPIMNKDFVKMCSYVSSTNPNINVSVHTNGSARSKLFWQDLARALPKDHFVVFALDGFADTHHLYRAGTDWNKIIDNAKTFIAAGGSADWMFIRFKHNEHQVVAAEQLSQQLGFKRFTVKDTRRFETPKFEVLDKTGKITHYLEQPSGTPIKFVDKRDLETYDNWPKKTDINCYALDQQEIYIDAFYRVLPCCILGAFLYTNYDKDILVNNNLYHNNSVVDFGAKIKQEVLNIVDELGNINALTISVKDIIENPVWETIWQTKWEQATSTCCIALCSASSPYITVDDQWIKGPDVQV